jgi:serine protein kinase
MSPWAVKRLEEYGGDIRKFKVVKRFPSVLKQIAVAKTEPGDENNQDISSLVGKVDIRKLETYAQDDPDAYSYSGGLCLANQGLLEFVEMFKAPIKVLHPLLTATQEGNFKGTEGFGAIPFDGIVLAHSNESEWKAFRNNKNNEAFLDRIYIVKVPYCLRVTRRNQDLREAGAQLVAGPGALRARHAEDDGQFSVLTRLKEPENSSIFSKMQVYDGENLKDTDPKAKSYPGVPRLRRRRRGHERHLHALRLQDHLQGLQLRQLRGRRQPGAPDVRAGAADRARAVPARDRAEVPQLHQGALAPRYAEFIGKEIQTAYLESYSEYGQNIFDRYVTYADYWIQDQEFRDTDTGEVFDRASLNAELEKIEKPAGIGNPKDFRNEIVNFVLRARANNAARTRCGPATRSCAR